MIPTPALARLIQRIMPMRNYRDVSKRSWALAPACRRHEASAVFHASDVSRILGVSELSTLSLQMERIYGGLRQHGATVAHWIPHVQLCHGHVVRPTASLRVGAEPMPWFDKPLKARVSQAVLASTQYGVRYFGHWLLDDLPLTLAAQSLGEAINVIPQFSNHQCSYLKLSNTGSRTLMDATVDEFIIIDDAGQNRYKAERLMDLRSRLLLHFPAPKPSKIMILRKNSGSNRTLLNEAEIAHKLSQQGFQILSPLETDAENLIQACLGASIVAGVEGSHLAHALLCMAPGNTLLTIQPPYRFDATLKDWCDCKQIRYAFTVGEPCNNGAFQTPFHQIDRLLQQLC